MYSLIALSTISPMGTPLSLSFLIASLVEGSTRQENETLLPSELALRPTLKNIFAK